MKVASVTNHQKMSALIINPKYSDDKKISLAGKSDADLCKRVFKGLAKAAGMQLQVTQLDGKKISKKKIEKWINAQKKAPPACAMLFYTGHGIADIGKSKWPRLQIADKKIVSSQSLMRKLESTGAGLTVSCLDACNNFLLEPHPSKKEKKALSSSLETSLQEVKKLAKLERKEKTRKLLLGAQHLLKKEKGRVRLAAARPGQVSTSFYVKKQSLSPFLLALYTNIFKSCIKNVHVSWKEMCDAVQERMKKTSQIPLTSIKK